MGAVIFVWESDIEGEMIAGVRVHLRRADRVEALRGLAVSLLELGAENAGPLADLVFLQKRVAAGRLLLLPDFEDRFFLEQPNQNGCLLIHALLFDKGTRLGVERGQV